MDVWVEIEEPRGAGLDIGWEPGRGLVVTGARGQRSWLGFDRGAVAETDAGEGDRLAAVVTLGHSAAAGVWVRATVAGVLADDGRIVVVARGPGGSMPTPEIARVAAGTGRDARWIPAADANRPVRQARECYRRRRAAMRVTDQPAWLPRGIGTGESQAGFYSLSESGLATLPPRFVRGLRDLLDDDERILGWGERPASSRPALAIWRRPAHKAGLLLVSDRQLVWMVDHVPPDRYLTEWGVDVQVVPIEAIRSAKAVDGALAVGLAGGELTFGAGTPTADVDALRAIIKRFAAVGSALRRRYPIPPVALDAASLAVYRQADEAAARVKRLEATAEHMTLAAFYAPRREGVRRATAFVLTENAVYVDDERSCRPIALGSMRELAIDLSPLRGRIAVGDDSAPASASFPWPLGEQAASFVRHARRAWANAV